MKKSWLTLGSIATMIAPIATVVACGNNAKNPKVNTLQTLKEKLTKGIDLKGQHVLEYYEDASHFNEAKSNLFSLPNNVEAIVTMKHLANEQELAFKVKLTNTTNHKSITVISNLHNFKTHEQADQEAISKLPDVYTTNKINETIRRYHSINKNNFEQKMGIHIDPIWHADEIEITKMEQTQSNWEWSEFTKHHAKGNNKTDLPIFLTLSFHYKPYYHTPAENLKVHKKKILVKGFK